MKPLVLALVLALVAGPFSAARAQAPAPSPSGQPLTAEDVLARSKAAEDLDDRPEAERESWMTRIAGLDGSLDVLRRGDDTVTETATGPFRTAHGISRGQRWHQNENGETILDRTEPSQAEHAVTQTLARVREPVDALEITTTFSSGHVTRFYYDRKRTI